MNDAQQVIVDSIIKNAIMDEIGKELSGHDEPGRLGGITYHRLGQNALRAVVRLEDVPMTLLLVEGCGPPAMTEFTPQSQVDVQVMSWDKGLLPAMQHAADADDAYYADVDAENDGTDFTSDTYKHP